MAEKEPIAQFQELFERAQQTEAYDSTAATLATADRSGQPSARMVLLKGADQRGFVFYTNLSSRKARELEANPRAALCFYWSSLAKQVRIEGRVERVTDQEADRYFDSRPRGSQIGAWASSQSEPLPSRLHLMKRFLEEQARFAGKKVPRPPFWGGFRLIPERIEFWHNQLHRLHERIVYVRDGDGWRSTRLYP